MIHAKIFFLICVLIGFSAVPLNAARFSRGVHSNAIPVCDIFQNPVHVGYCVFVPEHTNGEILYYLHGKGGSEQDWFSKSHYGQQLRSIWNEKKINQPIVVTISFGEIWLLAEKNSSPYSGLFEILTQAVMPQIESQLGGLFNGRRTLVGISMGGVNALQLALKTDLFSKAAALCAPVTSTLTPFSTEVEIREYAENTLAHDFHKGTKPNLVFNLLRSAAELSRVFYPLVEDWDRANPFALIDQIEFKALKMYLAIGVYDRYGSYEGNVALAHALNGRKINVEWRPQYGDHCAVDILSLSEFILN